MASFSRQMLALVLIVVLIGLLSVEGKSIKHQMEDRRSELVAARKARRRQAQRAPKELDIPSGVFGVRWEPCPSGYRMAADGECRLNWDIEW